MKYIFYIDQEVVSLSELSSYSSAPSFHLKWYQNDRGLLMSVSSEVCQVTKRDIFHQKKFPAHFCRNMKLILL